MSIDVEVCIRALLTSLLAEFDHSYVSNCPVENSHDAVDDRAVEYDARDLEPAS